MLFAYAFAGQIYCDFSAYTDIARGSAKLIGVDLVRNFNTPYFAASPIEFWHRWHISLSTWLRDYLYIPLGGNRHGHWMEYRNIMITMALGGLWHGAGALFILWGIWHGLMLVLYRVLPDSHIFIRQVWDGRQVGLNLDHFSYRLLWLDFFRAPATTIVPLLGSIRDLFTLDTWHNMGLFAIYGRGVLWLGAIMLMTDYLGYRKGGEFSDLFKNLNPYFAALVAIGCYFGIILLGKRESAQFIYFQF